MFHLFEVGPNTHGLPECAPPFFEYLKSLTARDITKIILLLYDITPPRKVKNRVFPQLQPFIKFFWEKIFTHYKNKKCCFRFRLSHALTRVFILYVEKKLKHKTVYPPPPRKSAYFSILDFFIDDFEKRKVYMLICLRDSLLRHLIKCIMTI